MGWLVLITGASMVLVATLREWVLAPLLLAGLVLLLAGIALVVGDVLGDHPRERRDR